jgi:hypothetical protein
MTLNREGAEFEFMLTILKLLKRVRHERCTNLVTQSMELLYTGPGASYERWQQVVGQKRYNIPVGHGVNFVPPFMQALLLREENSKRFEINLTYFPRIQFLENAIRPDAPFLTECIARTLEIGRCVQDIESMLPVCLHVPVHTDEIQDELVAFLKTFIDTNKTIDVLLVKLRRPSWLSWAPHWAGFMNIVREYGRLYDDEHNDGFHGEILFAH